MVSAHEGSVEELAPRAKAHREAAADHERRRAQFHEERATETQQEREHI